MARKNSNRSSSKRKNGGKQKGKPKRNGGGNRDMKKVVPSIDDLVLTNPDSPVKKSTQPSVVGPEVKRTEKKCSSNHPESFEKEKVQVQPNPTCVNIIHHTPSQLDDAYTSSFAAKSVRKYLGPQGHRECRSVSNSTRHANNDRRSNSNNFSILDEVKQNLGGEKISNSDEKSITENIKESGFLGIRRTDHGGEVNSVINSRQDILIDSGTLCGSVHEESPVHANLVCAPSIDKETVNPVGFVQSADLEESGLISKNSVNPRSLVSVVATVTDDSDCDSTCVGVLENKTKQPVSRSSSFSSWSELDDLMTCSNDIDELLVDDWNAIPSWS